MDYRLHLLEDWHEPPASPPPPVLLRMFEIAGSLPLVAPALLISDQSRCRAMEYRRHDEIRDCVAETVIHEFGHYFGLSEDEIEEIEEKYWRGDPMDDA